MKIKYKKPKKWTFKGKKYKIRWRKPRNALATCESPAEKDPVITIGSNLLEGELLSAVIDEVTHAHFWDLDNDSVDAFSDELAEFLLELGFTLEEIPLNE